MTDRVLKTIYIQGLPSGTGYKVGDTFYPDLGRFNPHELSQPIVLVNKVDANGALLYVIIYYGGQYAADTPQNWNSVGAINTKGMGTGGKFDISLSTPVGPHQVNITHNHYY